MDYRAVLTELVAGEVRFVLIGGVAAVVQGVPVHTMDVDIVHAREPENVRRLREVLRALEAHYRSHPNRRIEPTESDLMLPGHHLLITRFGPLDVLGAVSGGRDYAYLFERASAMDLGRGLFVQVVDLDALVEMKEELGRDKDRAQLPEYRRTLEQRRARGG